MKSYLSVAALVVLLVAMGAGLYLTSRSQEMRRGAFFAGTQVLLQPDVVTKNTNEDLPINLFVNSGLLSGSQYNDYAKVDFIKTELCFPTNIDIAVGTTSGNVVINTDAFDQLMFFDVGTTGVANQKCVILAIKADRDTSLLKSGMIRVALLKFKTLANAGTGSISINKNKTEVSGANPNLGSTDMTLEISDVTGTSYTIAGLTPTPIPTGTSKLTCNCTDGTTVTMCTNIVCSSSTQIDAICGPVCANNGGTRSTACLGGNPSCGGPTPTLAPSITPTASPTPTTVLSGACVLRDSYTNSPVFSAPDLGNGYAKMVKSGVNTITGLQQSCSQANYAALLTSYCSVNKNPAQQQVLTYDSSGNPVSTSCGSGGCAYVSCPVIPTVTPTPVLGCMGVQHCTNGNTTLFEYCGNCTGSGCNPNGFTCASAGFTCKTYADKVFYFDNLYPVDCSLLPTPTPTIVVPTVTPTRTITPTPIATAITSPNGGEVWTRGGTYTVTWTQSASATKTGLYMYTRNSGGTDTYIGAITYDATSNYGQNTYSWTIPPKNGPQTSPPDGNNIIIEVILRDPSGKNMGSDKSDNPFTIVSSTITCKECPSDFQCYTNGSEFKWFVPGYVWQDFKLAADEVNNNCGGVVAPSFRGKAMGDANCDGYTDGYDYSVWRREFKDSSLTLQPQGLWEADFTGSDGKCDGSVDGYDYSLWRREAIDNGGGRN
jgi:hypothetical protein